MKVLLSAFACEPGKGSEPEVGYRALLSAASEHEVWVITDEASVGRLRDDLRQRGLHDGVHIHPIPLGRPFDELTVSSFHWHYDRWQREAGRRAVALDRTVGFDVVHHVTLANFWTRAGVAILDRPLVWGPVGGGVNPPLSLLPELGLRGIVADAARRSARRASTLRPAVRRAPRRAAVIIVQNRQTLARLEPSAKALVLPNPTCIDPPLSPGPRERSAEVLTIGRLLPWKAVTLALRALRFVQHPDAVLRIIGEGPDARRLASRVRSWKLQDRVQFTGWLQRSEVLDSLASAGVLLHPALHDEGGMVIAEALSLGTPVVCLDHGGPAELVALWPRAESEAVRPGTPIETAKHMAAAIDRFLALPRPTAEMPLRPAVDFGRRILDAYDAAVSPVPADAPDHIDPPGSAGAPGAA